MRTFRGFLLIVTVAASFGQSTSRSGIHRSEMDETCKPCTDFWRYVNGTWLDKNPIPASRAAWGQAALLRDANSERIRTVIEAAAADSASSPGSDVRKMGDFYSACMNTAALNARGYTPLQPDFDRIQAVRTRAELVALLVSFQMTGRPFGDSNGAVAGPFKLSSGQDPKHPERVIARIVEREAPGRTGSSILSMPDRDYYFREDERSKQIRDAFLEHVAKLLQLTGESASGAAAQARTVLAFEKALAEAVMTIADKRDPDKTYHPMDLAGLRALAPNFDWALLLRESGLPESVTVNVSEPELLKRMNRELADAPLETWKVWLKWRDIQLHAAYLAQPFSEEAFHFQGTILAGLQQAPPRWETCAGYVDRDLTDALGKAFTEKYFPAAAKRRMSDLVENLRAALREQLEQSEWMQPATRKLAIAKLNALQVQIGYPARWHNYADLRMSRSDFFGDVQGAWIWGQRYVLAKVGKPASNVDWAMSTTAVNAYSNSAEVKVVFPAGILQPPYFDMDADDAANYGAIGAVIGHEIGHQFDDGGSKFDATGALNNWWTDEDRTKFEARTGCVVNQFNTLDVGGGLHHNGKQVLGEALGDLGGLGVAYRAYRKSLGGKEAPMLDGFTGEQRFFITFARVWGVNMRDEAMRLQLNTNNHPIARWRAIATLQNMPEFHRAFQCKPGDAMVRPQDEQCKLW